MQKMEYVTIHTKDGGIGIGKIDSEGRLVYRCGMCIPVPKEDADTRDRILRKDVKEIIRDGGREYERVLKGLMIPPTYKVR